MGFSLDKDQSDRLLKQADKLFQEARSLEAIAQYQAVISIEPNNVKALVQLKQIYCKQGNTDGLLNCLRKLIEIYPQEVKYYLHLAEILKIQENAFELKNICQKVIDLDSNQPLWIYQQSIDNHNKNKLLDLAYNSYLKIWKSSKAQPLWFYLSFGEILDRQQIFSQAIEVCQYGIQLYPKTAQLYLLLASVYYKIPQLDLAIEYCKKSLALDLTFKAYIQLAKIYQQKDEFDRAIAVYQQLLQSNYQGIILVYTGLGYCYYRESKWDLAIEYYEKAIPLVSGRCEKKDILDLIEALYLKLGKPEKATEQHKHNILAGSIVNHRHKIIYCPITKNACTLFKSMMLNQSSEREKYQASGWDIHAYASDRDNTNLVLKDFNLFNNSNYFKFAIFRNPFNRLVSAYLDKIVKHEVLEEFARKFIIDIQTKQGIKCNLKRSISFYELIEYLVTTEEYLINEHWRSQYTFLGLNLFKIDYIGQFEDLESTIKFLENKFNFKIEIDVAKNHDYDSHVTRYVSYNTSEKLYATLPAELRKLKIQHNGYPKTENFYTPELIEKVKCRFSRDIKIYQELFNKTIEEMV